MKYFIAGIFLMLGTQMAHATVQNEFRSELRSSGIQWAANSYSQTLSIQSPYDWSLSKAEIKTPKKHGAIYRFFHPKQERMWKGVHPDLREKIEAIQALMEQEGFDLRPIEGYRSPERQANLLASSSGVTSVGAWSSCHNFGLALDAAIYINGQPTWNTTDPHVLAGYRRFGELAVMLGLNWGGRWTSPVDMPHVEMKEACGQAKWAKRHGQAIPQMVASGGPASTIILYSLFHSSSPLEFEESQEPQLVSAFYFGVPSRWNSSLPTWSFETPILACTMPHQNWIAKI